MTRDEEIYWLNQPEWVINAEMEVRLEAYFERKRKLAIFDNMDKQTKAYKEIRDRVAS